MTVLVTGATGFLGRHVALRLAAAGEDVRCLVRPASADRLAPGLTAVSGDITEPRCGVDPAGLGDVGRVVHVAALYDLRAPEEACRAANVEGTANVLALCEALGARLDHVSTVGVAGDFDGAFGEDHFDEGQAHGHPYTATKFEAERLVREQSAVPWRVYRPGSILGDSTTGEADKADGLYHLFPIVRRLRGALPGWFPVLGFEGGPLPLAPVDFVADAIVALSSAPGLDGRTFHLVDPAPPTLGAFANTIARAAHAPRFAVRIDTSAFDLLPGVTDLVHHLGPVKRLRKRHLGGADLRPMARLLTGRTTIDATATTALLAELGVTCPPFEDYAATLWDYWDRTIRTRDRPTLPKRVAGRVVLVTGASAGIGREVALQVAAAGATTLLVARSADKLEALAGEIEAAGGTAEVWPCDCADYDAVDALVAGVTEAHGGVDVLVNNAGRSIRRGVAETRFHDYERTVQLNYLGALRLTLGLLPAMRERGDGHVVNVLTMGLQTRVPNFAAYLASKAALEAASASIAAEVLSDGVHFTGVYMPLVRTAMIAPTDVYKAFPALSPEEGADLVTEGIVTRSIRVTTGLGRMATFWGLIAPGSGLMVLNRGARMLPRRAAEGAGDGGRLVGKILKAVHW